VISASFRNDRSEIAFYANVPILNFGRGRTWIKSLFEFQFIKGGKPCNVPDNLENTGYGLVYVNTNDPNRPHVNSLSGNSRR